MLSEHRKELRVFAEAAENIESEVSEEQQAKTENRTNFNLKHKLIYTTIKPFNSSVAHSYRRHCKRYNRHTPLLEQCQSDQKSGLDISTFIGFDGSSQPPSTAKEMIGLIDQLSVDEVAELRAVLNNRFSSSATIDVPSAAGSGPPPTDGGTGSDLTFQPLNPQETAPEYVLRKLHEVIQAPHEKLAAEIRQAAEEYAQAGKSRRSRAEYKKLGDYYIQSAQDFIEAENWESGADCYARARLAYTANRRYSRARQCAQEAGTYYAMRADALEREQTWADAGRLYALSADNYAHANLWEAANQSLSRTTICYFNVAENARAIGDLSLCYDYCDRILRISKRLKRTTNAEAVCAKTIKGNRKSLYSTVTKYLMSRRFLVPSITSKFYSTTYRRSPFKKCNF